MLVKENISFERYRDPKKALGLSFDFKKEKNKIRSALSTMLSGNFVEKDKEFYFILAWGYVAGMSEDVKNGIMKRFENSPFIFDGFEDVNAYDLNLKKHNGANPHKVIVKFKFR
jgi:hypothetical protein